MLVGVVGVYVLSDYESENETVRAPASLPTNYDQLSGCEKQEVLWSKVQETKYSKLPEYKKFGVFQLLAMNNQEIQLKGKRMSDFAPDGWKKYLHRRGAIAKVKLVTKNSRYTGVFQGADCALLRLSLTYKPTGARPVAPGLAFKVLRDGTHSANISALVSLDGQEMDFNFFKNPMSNIVPIGEDIGQKLVHKVFRKASKYPEELLVNDLASIDAHGSKTDKVSSPRQLFFVPNSQLSAASTEHDVREDFFNVPEGTVVYQVFAVSDKHLNFDYEKYDEAKAAEFLKDAEHVADLVSTSKFVSSDFGDDGIFFRHQLRP